MEEKRESAASEQTAQQTGIFEPKPVNPRDLPLSGTQKAIRFCIGIAVLILAAIVLVLLKNPFMKPVNCFYKGLEQHDAAAMCEAFPAWLVSGNGDEESMTVYDMCATVLTYTNYNYGTDADIKVKYAAKTEVEEDYLSQLESGVQAQYGVELHITKGYWVTLNVTYSSGESQAETVEYVRLYRMNGRWVMLDIPSATQ